MMTGLVFILILIIMLLGLYLLDSYGDTEELNPNTSTEAPDNYNGYDEDDEGAGWYNEDDGAGWYNEEDDDGGGGGSTEWTYDDETEPTEETIDDGGGGDGDGKYDEPHFGYEDEGIKSAIFVELVDDETNRVIPQEGIGFELYRTDSTSAQDGTLETLYTYYPQKVSYREFETTEKGTFYLPEKIWQGNYYFHELNEVEGYDKAEDTYFEVDELFDWPEPFVVQVRVLPCKNIIRVQMNDSETEAPVSGGTFNIIAAEDVMTLDGTIRYTEGQIVGTITCDEDGYGESDELYLGKYRLEQDVIPEYYTGMLESLDVEVEKKGDTEPELHQIYTEKTKIVVTLSDALYTSEGITDATFLVSNETASTVETATTDTLGSFTLTDLDKNTVYTIRQQQTVGDYKVDESEYTIKVLPNGRINGESQALLELTNRMVRVSVHAVDAVLRSDTENVELSLYTDGGQLIKEWTSKGEGETFTGLDEGSYYVIRGDDTTKKYEFVAEDTETIQNWSVSLFTYKSAIGLALAAILVAVGIWVLVLLFRLIFRKRKAKKET